MIKVTKIVEDIVQNSDFIEIALQNNLLNLTEYARYIQDDIDKQTLKKVKLGTIVVALSRLSKQYKKPLQKKQTFSITELSMKSPLCEIVYEKTSDNMTTANKIIQEITKNNTIFFTITQSSSEIMLTINQAYENKILQYFAGNKPKTLVTDLIGISIKFDKEIIDQPSVLYSLLKKIAWKEISLVDVISTYSELIFIVRSSDAKEAFSVINDIYLEKNKI